jgi:tetratricopeptide (TPR) repeat protein
MLMPRLSATASGEADSSVPAADRQYFGYGIDDGWLPHRGQDDYDRLRIDREFVALVLENEWLRATFLPEIGGRLWSLVHKPTGRDLLFANPVFQPGNLAVRGAWVTGGVEWNACVYGHAPHTCSPLFAAAVDDPQYGTVLRLYEWDRTRCVPFQLDFMLPAGSPMLLARIRLTNPHDATIPMYWWSNVAVAAAPDVRVLAPARTAYTYDYWGPVKMVSVPEDGDLDLTYPTTIPYGADYFFRIPDGSRPWIAALDGQGRGIIQTSTRRQIGRKLFAWGSQAGGERWQDFLSTPGKRFFEIQAGLARTQLECLPMPAGVQWEWMEAYGLLEADPQQTHGGDWNAAIREVEEQLQQMNSPESLEALLLNSTSVADRAPDRILHRGSGWGALERIRRERSGEPAFCSQALAFDDESLTSEQRPWLSLLEEGALPEVEPNANPGAWMVQDQWRRLLIASINDSRGDHWLAHLHLGVMHYARDDSAAARGAWEESLRQRASAWAYRNLAILSKLAGRHSEALSQYAAALAMLPRLRPLLVEYCEYLLERGLNREALDLIDKSPSALRAHSRVQFLEARAAIALGLPDRWAHVLSDSFELVDLREGETSLTNFWIDLAKAGLNHGNPSLERTKTGWRIDPGLPAQLDFQVAPNPHYQLSPESPPREQKRMPKSGVA